MQQHTIDVISGGVVEFAGNVPGNGFPFAIGIRGKKDLFGVLGLRAEFLQNFIFALDGDVFRGEIVRDINAKAPFGQVFDMPNGRFH